MAERSYINPVAERRCAPAFLSVVIPSYNRRDRLIDVLECLSHPKAVERHDYEIVLGDDGSGDGTADAVRQWAASAGVAVRCVFDETNRGPAHARNRAMAMAAGEVLLITGDDIRPAPDLLSRHIRWHRDHPDARDALLGRVTWPADPPPTPFMRWLERGGKAFYFDFPDRAGPVSPDRFYTCNVSVKRAWVDRFGGFDETFPFASHEDIEFGIRLADQGGMRLHYDPEAVGIHDHRLSAEGMIRRVYLNGYSSVLFWRKVPRRSSIAMRCSRRVCQAMARCCPTGWIRIRESERLPLRWTIGLLLSYWRGVADGAAGRLNPVLAGRRPASS